MAPLVIVSVAERLCGQSGPQVPGRRDNGPGGQGRQRRKDWTTTGRRLFDGYSTIKGKSL